LSSYSIHLTDLFFFCTPVHRSAQGMIAGTDNEPFRASQHSTLARGRARPCLPGFVAASVFSTLPCLCANLFMGCRGFWFTPTPHVPGAALTPCTRVTTRKRWAQAIFLGTRLGLRKRPLRANAYCLRPQAHTSLWPVLMSAKREYRLFTRASGRGLRRVKNVVQDAKGMCKKRACCVAE